MLVVELKHIFSSSIVEVVKTQLYKSLVREVEDNVLNCEPLVEAVNFLYWAFKRENLLSDLTIVLFLNFNIVANSAKTVKDLLHYFLEQTEIDQLPKVDYCSIELVCKIEEVVVQRIEKITINVVS